uniref:Uncharacterized protein n=1 Tax=Globodera rostochiensis TaxID=31243 RepID=A0A914HQT8_GLORO
MRSASTADQYFWRQFVNRHRKLLSDFKFDELEKQQFNFLMLLTALKTHADTALRQRLLAKLASDGARITYDAVDKDLINYRIAVKRWDLIM